MTEEEPKSAGIQTSIHGDVYQIKLLMLYMHRGLENGYEFNLSSEDQNADKFDDIVFSYNKSGEDINSHRFLQAKHKQDETKKITYKHLLNHSQGDFSLKKYFTSYRKIKENVEQGKNIAKEFIICTNIDFSTDAERVVKEINRTDPIMDVTAPFIEKSAKYCKIQLSTEDDLYFTLKSSTDSNALTQQLANSINKGEKITRRGLIKTYHKWLVDNVIDRETKTIRSDIADTAFSRELLRLVKDNKNKAINIPNNFFDKIDNEGVDLTDFDVNDKDIWDFLNNLVFAVNQPNEMELSNIITREIGEKLNLLQAEVVTDLFFKEILNWLKNKDNRKHTKESSLALFEGMKEKIENLLHANIDIMFKEQLRSCSVDFLNKNKTLKDFLNDRKAKLLNFVCVEPFLGSLEIYFNTDKTNSPYKAIGSKTFVDMNQVVYFPSIIKTVENLFKRNGVYNLLIIKCRPGVTRDTNLIKNLLEILSVTESKKIILVSTEPIKFTNPSFSVELTSSFITFSDFARTTQNVLKKRKVNFQGYNKLLSEIVEQKYLTTIQGKFLLSLILNEKIVIGNKLDKIKDEYIPRQFSQWTEFKRSLLTDSVTFTDTIIITGDEKLSELEITNTAVKVMADRDWDESEFGESSEGIHWLNYKNNKLIWHSSNRSVVNLLPFREESAFPKKKSDLLNEKISVISGIAGMGKSKVLVELANEMKQLDKKRWVVIIDLNSELCQTALNENIGNNFNKDMAKRFLTDNLLQLGKNNSLERDLFMRSLEGDSRKTPISLLIDGFDEINPNSGELVIRLLKAMEELNIANISVTTRPHLRNTLETRLGVFSYTLEPFPPEHQRRYLLHFFKSELSCSISDRLEKYVTCLMDNISYSFDEKEIQFIGIPLHIEMVAAIFVKKTEAEHDWQTCEEFLVSTSDEPILPKSLGFIKLYDVFYKHKIAVYRSEKSKDKLDSDNKTAGLNVITNQLLRYQQKLSLKLFFNKQDVNDLEGQLGDICEDLQKQLPKLGFVINTGTDQIYPEFTHRTFAEYFTAQFFINLLEKPNDKIKHILFTKVLLNLEFKVIRAFLNNHISPKDLECKADDVYLAELWRKDPGLVCNKNNQTILQIVTQEGNIHLMDFILRDLMVHEDIKEAVIQHKDKDGQTALHSAVKSGIIEIVKKLYDPQLQIKDNYGRSLLYVAALHRHWHIVEWLFKENMPLEGNDINIKRVFHIAGISGNLDMVKLFLENKVFDRCFVKGSGILLHLIKYGQLNIMKWILENKYFDIDEEDNYATLLYASFENSKRDIVMYLQSCCGEKYNSIFKHIAAEYGQYH